MLAQMQYYCPPWMAESLQTLAHSQKPQEWKDISRYIFPKLGLMQMFTATP